MWVIKYEANERTYCVGYYDPQGTWISHRDFPLIEEAARYLHWINGGHGEKFEEEK